MTTIPATTDLARRHPLRAFHNPDLSVGNVVRLQNAWTDQHVVITRVTRSGPRLQYLNVHIAPASSDSITVNLDGTADLSRESMMVQVNDDGSAYSACSDAFFSLEIA